MDFFDNLLHPYPFVCSPSMAARVSPTPSRVRGNILGPSPRPRRTNPSFPALLHGDADSVIDFFDYRFSLYPLRSCAVRGFAMFPLNPRSRPLPPPACSPRRGAVTSSQGEPVRDIRVPRDVVRGF